MGIFRSASTGSYHHHDCLAIESDRRPVKQAPRRMHLDLTDKIEAEVDRLITAKFIRELQYLVLLANVVPIKKNNRQIRVYIDFKDLEAYPKDDFSVLHMELLIDEQSDIRHCPSWMGN